MDHHQVVLGRVLVRFTRQGFQALTIGVFCLAGAIIRDLNLLVILAGLVAGVMWMQWRIGRKNLGGVCVFQELPHEAFVGIPFSIRIVAANQARSLGAFQLSASTPIVSERTSDRAAMGNCFVAAVGPQQQSSAQFRCQSMVRGRFRLGPLKVESEFPFGLLRCVRELPSAIESLVVFPRLLPLKAGWRKQFHRYLIGGNRPGHRAGIHEGQFFGLRTWQAGDSRRWIHWRTTARIGEIAVRQFEQPRDEQMLLVVDLFDLETPEAVLAIERAISLAGTITEQLTRSTFFRLVIGIAGTQGLGAAGTAASQVRRMALTMLAEAQGTVTPCIDEMLAAIGSVAGKHWPLMVISTRAYGSNVWPETAQRWLDAQGASWIRVTDPTLESWVEWSNVNGTR